MVEVKRIGVLSLAKIQGLTMAIFGLIAGIFMALAQTLISAVAGSESWWGFLAVILLPVMYGIFGFIAGAIGAVLYNLIAGWIGGLELDLKQ